MTRVRSRVAVVSPYWTFWEHTLGSDFGVAHRVQIARISALVSEYADVVVSAQVESPDAAVAEIAKFRAAAPDALLVVSSIAAPPTTTMALLDRLPGVPVVVWAMHDMEAALGVVDHRAITANGATVGTPMITNVLGRRGRPFEVVMGRLQDPRCLDRVRRALVAAAAAGSIKRARLGRIGEPIEGYEQVDVDGDALREAIGIEVVSIPAAALAEAYRRVTSDQVASIRDELRISWDVVDEATNQVGLDRSIRAAAALEQLAGEHHLDAGALNCHVPEIRFSPEIGITPCFALGRSTSIGIPWTCTGDSVTAVAMLAVKRLGGAALYHELETADYSTGELVIANSGEHDLGWMDPSRRPRLAPNGWYRNKDPVCGFCAVMEPSAGPATLVGFTPHKDARRGFRFVAASGHFTGRTFPACGTANAAFRFDGAPLEDAWPRWARAGVNHHSCATPGHLADAVASMAMHLDVGVTVI